MGRAIDLFVTYRFIKLLTTPFEKTDAFKLGIIDENGNRIKDKTTRKPVVVLNTSELKKGIYFIDININNSSITQKLIVSE